MAPEMIELLLETTIQLYRVAGVTEVKREINRELHGKQVCTTSFVFRESLRTIINDVAYVHRIAEQIPEGQDGRVALGRLVNVLASGPGNFSPRSRQRGQYVVAEILDSFNQNCRRVPLGT
jgi:hypothetical protein